MKKYKTVFEHPIKKRAIEVFKKDPETMDEFFQSIIDSLNDNFANSKDNAHVRVTGLAMRIQHSSNVSNSHSSPLLGVQNFCSRDNEDLPRGYPGWRGRVWVRFSDSPRGFGSDIFRSTMTHTGTGGAGSYDGPWSSIATIHYRSDLRFKKLYPEPKLLSWDYKVFDMDFPGLSGGPLKMYNEEMVEYEKLMEVWRAEMTWYKATGKNYPREPKHPDEPKFYKEWTCPEQQQKDEDFIKLIKRTNERRVLNKSKEYA